MWEKEFALRMLPGSRGLTCHMRTAMWRMKKRCAFARRLFSLRKPDSSMFPKRSNGLKRSDERKKKARSWLKKLYWRQGKSLQIRQRLIWCQGMGMNAREFPGTWTRNAHDLQLQAVVQHKLAQLLSNLPGAAAMSQLGREARNTAGNKTDKSGRG